MQLTFRQRMQAIAYRIWWLLYRLPHRSYAWCRHVVLVPLGWVRRRWWEKLPYEKNALSWWLLELLLKTLAIAGVMEWYEILICLTKPQLRSLTPKELRLCREVFGQQLQAQHILIDEHNSWVARQLRTAYVIGHVVHSWGVLPMAQRLHEWVHVWQYQQMGSCYIAKALYAQGTTAGYNYGGLTQLLAQPVFYRYNLEQQADIVEDAYRLQQGAPPSWGNATTADVFAYQQILNTTFGHTKRV